MPVPAWARTLIAILMLGVLSGCRPAPEIEVAYDPASLRFDGERAFALEGEFVTRFTHRHSGTEQSRLATEWLREQFTGFGWSCRFDDWEIVNYSQPVSLRNILCTLPGDDDREILVVAHHDQAPTTVQGADNNGSGIAILLHLAEIFAAEPERRYTLVFVATDAEEYGMIGSRRAMQTHPNVERVIAGVSLDNLGRDYYTGVGMELVGQFRGYGALWLALAVREATKAAGDVWVPGLPSAFDQVLDQAAPVSMMDQGPIGAAGVPALGLAGVMPGQYLDLHFALWHSPDDTMEHQSPEALEQSGRVAEATVRQLLGMREFPEATGPYIYFDASGQMLTGWPLWLLFFALAGIFLVGGLMFGRGPLRDRLEQWRRILPHFLGFWLPLVGALLLLYLLVEVGLLHKYHLYPATSKDPELLTPRWPAILIFLGGLILFLWAGTWMRARLAGPVPSAGAVKSFALLVIAAAGVYVLAINPFSLVFFVPLLAWFLIAGWRGIGRIVDIALFAAGGLVVYALIYIFGFQVLRLDWLFLWYLLNLLATRTVGFWTVAAVAAILASGLTMLSAMPQARAGKFARSASV